MTEFRYVQKLKYWADVLENCTQITLRLVFRVEFRVIAEKVARCAGNVPQLTPVLK